MKNTFRALLGIATYATLHSVALATLLTYEDFNYTSGVNITSLNGGSGWLSSSSWATGGTTGTVSATGLSYTGANASYTAFSSSGLAASINGSNFKNYRTLDYSSTYNTAGLKDSASSSIGGSTAGTLWGSFLLSGSVFSGGSGSQFIWSMGTGTGSYETVSIRQGSAGAAFGVTNTSGGSFTNGSISGNIAATSLSTSNPNLIVFRYVFGASANTDTFDVWLNPLSSSATASISGTGMNLGLQTVEFRSANANGNLAVDEIRFGTTFSDVVPSTVPEPSTYAILGVGILAIGALRKRK